ncbi:MAG: M28 family peptidase [Flavobacteriales bacterium]|nr:M28 family peptidase [Flavobacteriales bacterium]MCB9449407.1 M28 family peptidase [Flavobacteriales bacterium]
MEPGILKPFLTGCMLTSLVIACGCGGQKESDKDQKAEADAAWNQVTVPVFNADSAYDWVARQVAFGPRVPNSTSHDSCAHFLETTLARLGCDVEVQRAKMPGFKGDSLPLTNIIASVAPDLHQRILIVAHWDTRAWADEERDSTLRDQPIPGANDGGSGTAILLELARAMQTQMPPVGVDLLFLDLQDQGQTDPENPEQASEFYCLGAQYWSRNKYPIGASHRYGIVVNLVGGKDARFAREGVSMYYAESVVNKVWQTASKAGFSDRFLFQNAPAVTDDHTFLNEWGGIPTIDIIEYDPQTGHYFGPNWHTHADDLSGIDKATLRSVGQTLLEVIYREQ